MLIDEVAFEKMTNILVEQGVIRDFERDSGKITGHMMITKGEIPEDLGITIDTSRNYFVFEGSFDFYSSTIGIALYMDTFEPIAGVWVTPQVDDAEPPAKDWIEFFVQTVVEQIQDEDGFGYPMYTYVNDTSDFTVVPTRPE
jgi:hypothetical protein